MAQENINLGTPPTGTDGDTTRTALQKAQDNFTDLYTLVGTAQSDADTANAAASAASTAASAAQTTANPLLPAGSTAGQVMTSTGASSAPAWASSPLAFKNKLINGNFDFWQRGTTNTATGYLADRWLASFNTTTCTVSQQAFALGQTAVPNNPKYFLRHVVTSGATSTSYCIAQQRIEGAQVCAGKTVTVSFWAKADAARSLAVEFNRNYGTGGSPSTTDNIVDGATHKLALTTVWQKFTVSAAIPSISGKTLGTNGNDYLGLFFWFDGGSSFDARTGALGNQSGTFDIAQVQMEEGSAATPFDLRPLAVELAMCQRYYRHPGTDGVRSRLAVGQAVSSTSTEIVYSFPPMRAAPTVKLGFASVVRAGTATTVTGGPTFATSISNSCFGMLLTHASVGASAGEAILLESRRDSGPGLELDAEL